MPVGQPKTGRSWWRDLTSSRVPSDLEKSLRQEAVRVNQVVGHHEGEGRRDTKTHQKADEEGHHDSQGHGPLRIAGFSPFRMGRGIGSLGFHWGEITKPTLLFKLQKQPNLLPAPVPKGTPFCSQTMMGHKIRMLPALTM